MKAMRNGSAARRGRRARAFRPSALARAGLAGAFLLCAGASGGAGAEELQGGLHRETEGSRYPVSRIELEASGPGLDAALAELRELEFAFGVARDGYVGPRRGGRNAWFRLGELGGQGAVPVYASGLRELAEQIVGALNARGLVGAYAAPHPRDVDPATGRDLRPYGRYRLRLLVYAAPD